VFVLFGKEVHGYDVANLELCWKQTLPHISTSLAVSQKTGNVYASDYHRGAHAFSSTGEELWTAHQSSHFNRNYSTCILVLDESVLLVGSTGSVTAYDAASGKFLWKKVGHSPFCQISISLALSLFLSLFFLSVETMSSR
jgi:outer membrane protein assembly factor BamB